MAEVDRELARGVAQIGTARLDFNPQVDAFLGLEVFEQREGLRQIFQENYFMAQVGRLFRQQAGAALRLTETVVPDFEQFLLKAAEVVRGAIGAEKVSIRAMNRLVTSDGELNDYREIIDREDPSWEPLVPASIYGLVEPIEVGAIQVKWGDGGENDFVLSYIKKILAQQIGFTAGLGILGRSSDPRMIQRALDHPDQVIGKEAIEREVAIVFADLKGFTNMSEQLTTEQVLRVLNKYYAVIFKIVQAHGGYINAIMGDGLMLDFGAPYALEDMTAQAVQACLAVQGCMEMIGEEMREQMEVDVEVKIRFGVNQGVVVAGLVGGDSFALYSTIGSPTNQAARTEPKAKPGTVAVTEAVYKLLADRLEVEEMGEFDFKGVSEKVKLFRAVRFKSGCEPEIIYPQVLINFPADTSVTVRLQEWLRQYADSF